MSLNTALKTCARVALAIVLWSTIAAAQSVSNVGASWTSLGYGPLMLSAPSASAGQVQFAVSDTTPSAAGGTPVPPTVGVAVLTTHQIWAIAPGASSPIAVTATPYPGQVGYSDGSLPSGAATAANQPALNGDGGALAHVMNFPATQPVSAVSLPLPAGAATAAGQTNVQGPMSPGAPASNSVAVGGVYNSSLPTVASGQQVALQTDPGGRLYVNVSGGSSSNGQTLGFAIAPATPSATTLKSVQGRLYWLNVCNSGASAVYLKLFNTGTVTLGTTAATLSLMEPAGVCVSPPIGVIGLYFSAGIAFAVTGGIGATDNTAITASTVSVNYSYQ